MPFLDILTIASLGLLVGTEFAVSAFVNPVVWKLEDRAQGSAIALFAARLGKVMPFWYSLNLLLLIFEIVTRWHEPGRPLLIVTGSVWVAVILFTVVFLVPINNRMARLGSDSFSETARRERKKWDALHRLRVLAVGIALIFSSRNTSLRSLVASITLRRREANSFHEKADLLGRGHWRGLHSQITPRSSLERSISIFVLRVF